MEGLKPLLSIPPSQHMCPSPWLLLQEPAKATSNFPKHVRKMIILIIFSQLKDLEREQFGLFFVDVLMMGIFQKSACKDRRTNAIIGCVKWKLGTGTETGLLQRREAGVN